MKLQINQVQKENLEQLEGEIKKVLEICSEPIELTEANLKNASESIKKLNTRLRFSALPILIEIVSSDGQNLL